MRKLSFIITIILAGSLSGSLQADEGFQLDQSDEFRKIVSVDAQMVVLGSEMKFLEGPVWVPRNGGYLVFSDIPANQLYQWTAGEGVSVFRNPSRNTNGNCLDPGNRLISCEHGGRRVSIENLDGKQYTIVENYNGKKLNSPNDVVVKSDGSIWFTDPDYGLAGRTKEQPGNYVYRFDPYSQTLKVQVKDFDRPNGLCFSPDETKLYIADSGKPKHIRVFNVQADGEINQGRVFCRIDQGGPDGIRSDVEGRIFSSAGDGVHIFAPDGSRIGKIFCPEAPANLCFGGWDYQTLFITARSSLYAIELKVPGNR
ncbi:MAG TPA: SMP-30/gluconolactonase/LRE family protein [Verrucomicrobiales bacterium]|nr:SMP-30/gluconolactonase/LRE family protein [Verrucomicrobiales bacterium]HIL70549.1 SMP-30/gluconolactonase/LRE family protein [Verrucomicrobiota bacterium]